MKDTKIEWADHTVNFWWGCEFARLSTGAVRQECEHCYALLLSKLFSRGKATWGPNGNRWVRHEAARRELYRIDKAAYKAGVRQRVFINSMSDTFEDRPNLNEARGFLWDACRFVTNLDILLLTKRPGNVMRMVPAQWLEDWPAHVWIGTTCGTQDAADEAVPALLKIPARVRFLSVEPMLGPVDLSPAHGDWSQQECHDNGVPYPTGIHWVICGGESGQKARPLHPDWARSLRDQCASAGVPFLFKQWGEWAPASHPEDADEVVTAFNTWPNGRWLDRDGGGKHRRWNTVLVDRVGKHAAGRLLDGREHNEFPEVRS